MKKSKLAAIGLSFAFAVGCGVVAAGQWNNVQSASAEGENTNPYVYSIENVTKGTLYEISFLNDYFGYSAPYQYSRKGTEADGELYTPASTRFSIAYTYDACYDEQSQKAEVTVSTIYFKGQDQYMVVSPDDATGKYKVDSVVNVAAEETSFTFTIPAPPNKNQGALIWTPCVKQNYSLRWHYPNQVKGRRLYLPLSP